ncbi:unnamed protein product [Tuber melanosporum]|uniref:(Perigord truffle) hypothetical protein n=1 Tax=Tuber melanosporum (strain Mel28) TaxID=656061 RepID=D5G539_TUBMM|nr:uncharacterized protein GSTUM_00000239001 [Tuber melanosporum]CAZ79624.1 unnamed protein product [Tuber melanosporum]
MRKERPKQHPSEQTKGGKNRIRKASRQPIRNGVAHFIQKLFTDFSFFLFFSFLSVAAGQNEMGCLFSF